MESCMDNYYCSFKIYRVLFHTNFIEVKECYYHKKDGFRWWRFFSYNQRQAEVHEGEDLAFRKTVRIFAKD